MKVTFTRDQNHLLVDEATVAYLRAMDHYETHAGHHTICRNVYAAMKGGGNPAPSALITNGVDVISGCIAPDRAAALTLRIDEAIGEPTPPNTTVPLSAALRAEFGNLVPDVLTPEVTDLVEGYLGSHFRVVQCQLYRTQTGGRPHVSFLWHRDMEPMAQVHIMLYLTPSGPGDPGTEFLTLAGTRQLADAGYAFPHFNDRVDDLADVLPADAPKPDILRPNLNAGDATIFAAPRVLHRGLDGTGGYRDVFLLNLLPGLVPWRHDFDRFGIDRLFWKEGDSNTIQANPFTLMLTPDRRTSGKPVSRWVTNGDLLPEGFS